MPGRNFCFGNCFVVISVPGRFGLEFSQWFCGFADWNKNRPSCGYKAEVPGLPCIFALHRVSVARAHPAKMPNQPVSISKYASGCRVQLQKGHCPLSVFRLLPPQLLFHHPSTKFSSQPPTNLRSQDPSDISSLDLFNVPRPTLNNRRNGSQGR